MRREWRGLDNALVQAVVDMDDGNLEMTELVRLRQQFMRDGFVELGHLAYVVSHEAITSKKR